MNKKDVPTKKTNLGVKLILNGGNRVLDSATVPIQWYFSEEVIEQSPQSIVLVDLSEVDLRKDKEKLGTAGQRTLIRVKRRNQFLQFNHHGTHKLLVLVFKEDLDKDEKFASNLVEESFSSFDNSISFTDTEKFIQKGGNFLIQGREVLAAEIIELEIPKGLFASKPETKLGKKAFKWINSWHQKELRDECEFRKRIIFAFTLKPILWFVFVIFIWEFLLKIVFWTALIPIIWHTFVTIWRGVIALFATILGFYPTKEFWTEIGDFWYHWYVGEGYCDELLIYLLDLDFSEYKKIGNKKYFLAPWHVILVLLLASSVYILLTGLSSLLFLAKIVGGAFIFAGVVFVLVKIIQAIPGKSYEGWLMKHTKLDFAPDSISSGDLEVSFNHKLTNKFKIRFWATKAKVCRPYARN